MLQYKMYRCKTNLYHPVNLQYPELTYKSRGAHLVIIMDFPPLEDSDDPEHRLLSGNKGTVFSNIVGYVKRTEKIGRIEVLNYYDCSYEDAHGPHAEAIKAHLQKRMARFLERYKPDVVVFMGEHSYRDTFNVEWHDWKININRIYKRKIRGKHYKVIPTLDLLTVATSNQGNYQTLPSLSGFIVDALSMAAHGRNRYTISTLGYKPIYVDTIPKFDKALAILKRARRVCFDVEADNLNRIANQLFSIQASPDGKHAFFIPIYHAETPFTPSELEYILKELKTYFTTNQNEYHIYHNGKYDVQQLLTQIKLPWYKADIYDTTAGEFCLDENRKFLTENGWRAGENYSLENFEHKYGYVRKNLAIGKEDRKSIASFSIKDLYAYGCIDVITPFQICDFQLAEARRRGYKQFKPCVIKIIGAMIHSFTNMEHNGYLIDKRYLMELQSDNQVFKKELDRINAMFRKLPSAQKANAILLKRRGAPGHTLFSDSANDNWVFDIHKQESQQVLFFDVLGLKGLEELKNGQGYKVNKKFQKAYKGVEEVKLLQRYNQVDKAFNTFVTGIWKILIRNEDAAVDGCLRAYYGFISVITGRYSASKPGYQQIPSHSDLSKTIKREFIAAPLKMMIKADFSAQEVLGLANITEDPVMAKTFRQARKIRLMYRLAQTEEDIKNWGKELAKKGDIHILNVKFFFNQWVTKKHPLRSAIKAIVFGVCYGLGTKSLGQNLRSNVEDELYSVRGKLADNEAKIKEYRKSHPREFRKVA